MIARQRDAQDWGLPASSRGPHDHRQQRKARFIYQDSRALLVFGVFFCAVATAARSNAQWRAHGAVWRVSRVFGGSSPSCGPGTHHDRDKRTPHSRVIATASLRLFQTSPTDPEAVALFANTAEMCACCSAVRRGLAPGAGWAVRVSSSRSCAFHPVADRPLRRSHGLRDLFVDPSRLLPFPTRVCASLLAHRLIAGAPIPFSLGSFRSHCSSLPRYQ